MTRVTNDIRGMISRATITEQFAKRRAEIDKRSDKLACAIHAHVYNKSELTKVAELPEEWVKRGNKFRVNAGGWTIDVLSKKALPIMRDYRADGYSMFTTLTADTKLCEDFRQFATDVKQLDEDIKKAETALGVVLGSANTFAQLRETWPDGAKFYNPLEPKNENTKLPAIKVAEVNALLGLP